MKPSWSLAPKAPSVFFKELSTLEPAIAQILWNRGIKDPAQADAFLHPDLERDAHDPFLFKDMEKAVSRVETAVKNSEKIAIWGDYDCDGVCGTAIMFTLFKALGYEDRLNIHIPDRNREGYGLTMPHLAELAEDGVKVLITVDCGSTDVDEIAWARKNGMDVIVTDHHIVPSVLPDAYATLNPKDSASGYPFDGLAGTGVALKFALAIESRLQTKSKDVSVGMLKWLDLVALATLADNMPMIDENRVMAAEGMARLNVTDKIGLKALLEFCELSGGFSVRDLLFSVIPRINAMGRMAHASISFRLLTTDKLEEVDALIRHLDEKNRERQLVIEVVSQEVMDRVAKEPEGSVIFESSSNWMPGILGLAAQKVMVKLGKPVVLALEDASGGRVMGNARAMGAFNIVDVMRSKPELFSEAGGHAHAAGFSTTSEKLDAVKKLFLAAGDLLSGEAGFSGQEILHVDSELKGSEITNGLYGKLRLLQPFGEANPEPQFVVRGLQVAQSRAVGNGEKHLKMKFRFDSAATEKAPVFIDAIAFNFGARSAEFSQGCQIDAVAKISENEWNGRKSLELNIVDLDRLP
jgi:single-stranded-DNA-specific exonuclease